MSVLATFDTDEDVTDFVRCKIESLVANSQLGDPHNTPGIYIYCDSFHVSFVSRGTLYCNCFVDHALGDVSCRQCKQRNTVLFLTFFPFYYQTLIQRLSKQYPISFESFSTCQRERSWSTTTPAGRLISSRAKCRESVIVAFSYIV